MPSCRPPHDRMPRRAAPVLALLVGLSAAACAADPAPRCTVERSAATPRPAGPGTGGPGSLTVVLTQPQPQRARRRGVSCTSRAPLYRASGSGKVQGNDVRLSLSARGYRDPGDYQALVTLSIGTLTELAVVMNGLVLPVRITDAGGTVPLSGTAGGREIVGTVDWACSP